MTSNGSKHLSQHQPKAERHWPGREPRPQAPYLGQREVGSPTPISTGCPPVITPQPAFQKPRKQQKPSPAGDAPQHDTSSGKGPVHALSHRERNVSTPPAGHPGRVPPPLQSGRRPGLRYQGRACDPRGHSTTSDLAPEHVHPEGPRAGDPVPPAAATHPFREETAPDLTRQAGGLLSSRPPHPAPARPPRQRDRPLARNSVPTNPTGCGAAPASSPPPRRPSRISAPPHPGCPHQVPSQGAAPASGRVTPSGRTTAWGRGGGAGRSTPPYPRRAELGQTRIL